MFRRVLFLSAYIFLFVITGIAFRRHPDIADGIGTGSAEAVYRVNSDSRSVTRKVTEVKTSATQTIKQKIWRVNEKRRDI